MRRLGFVAFLLIVACGEPVTTETTTAPTSPTTASTTSTTSVTVPDDAAAALGAARTRWAEADLETYHFTLTNDCGECMPEAPRLVTVWDGATFDSRGTDIEALFDLIEAAITGGETVEVEYDTRFGHPVDIWIDREARAYDGGTHLLVSDVREGLPGEDVALADLDTAWDRWKSSRPVGYEFRTDVICDCPFDVTTWTLVDGERIVDWVVEVGTADVAPITIDALFADLRDLMAEGEVVEGGARITGSAAYDSTLGYPVWVGLDVEILDPDSALGDLPPRLVFVVRDFAEREGDGSELETAMRRWAEVGPGDYTYELTVHDVEKGSFSDPYLVTVTGGVLDSVTQNGEDVHPDNVPAYTVDELFRLIEQWRNVGFEVDLLFDERLGHPVVVSLDMGDDVEFFSIDALRPR